jgi:hypothetical protein
MIIWIIRAFGLKLVADTLQAFVNRLDIAARAFHRFTRHRTGITV